VDKAGQVIQVEQSPIVSSGNPSYDDLAICAIKTWKFHAAYNRKDGGIFYVSSNLNVEIKIVK
jgi:outer membrane biosynthesis protein TonB